MERNLLILASTAVLLAASAAFAGTGLKLDATSEMFQYGDSIYAWDPESGGAVRVGAIWDGFSPASRAQQAPALFHDGDYVFERDPQTGEKIKLGAVWDGAVASQRDMASTLALKR